MAPQTPALQAAQLFAQDLAYSQDVSILPFDWLAEGVEAIFFIWDTEYDQVLHLPVREAPTVAAGFAQLRAALHEAGHLREDRYAEGVSHYFQEWPDCPCCLSDGSVKPLSVHEDTEGLWWSCEHHGDNVVRLGELTAFMQARDQPTDHSS